MNYRILRFERNINRVEYTVEYKELLFWHDCKDFHWGTCWFEDYICFDEKWKDGIFSELEAQKCLKALKSLASHKYPEEDKVTKVYEE